VAFFIEQTNNELSSGTFKLNYVKQTSEETKRKLLTNCIII